MLVVLLLFSSSHSCSTGFRSEDWNGHSRSLVLCPVTHFCVVFEVCVWIIVWLEDPNMAHYKISNRVSHFWFCICWYLIESVGITVSKPTKTYVSKQDVQDLQQKYRPTTSKIQQCISLYTWVLFNWMCFSITCMPSVLKGQHSLLSVSSTLTNKRC